MTLPRNLGFSLAFVFLLLAREVWGANKKSSAYRGMHVGLFVDGESAKRLQSLQEDYFKLHGGSDRQEKELLAHEILSLYLENLEGEFRFQFLMNEWRSSFHLGDPIYRDAVSAYLRAYLQFEPERFVPPVFWGLVQDSGWRANVNLESRLPESRGSKMRLRYQRGTSEIFERDFLRYPERGLAYFRDRATLHTYRFSSPEERKWFRGYSEVVLNALPAFSRKTYFDERGDPLGDLFWERLSIVEWVGPGDLAFQPFRIEYIVLYDGGEVSSIHSPWWGMEVLFLPGGDVRGIRPWADRYTRIEGLPKKSDTLFDFSSSDSMLSFFSEGKGSS